MSDALHELRRAFDDGRGRAELYRMWRMGLHAGFAHPRSLGAIGPLRGAAAALHAHLRAGTADELFSHPTILEMNDLNENDKALVVLFVLTMLREHRELHGADDRLVHVTVVEEAHNVLANVAKGTEGQANTRHGAVQSWPEL